MEDKVITILVPWTHDEETGLDIYDTDFAHDTFINEIAECESHNQNIFDAWNEKQKTMQMTKIMSYLVLYLKKGQVVQGNMDTHCYMSVW